MNLPNQFSSLSLQPLPGRVIFRPPGDLLCYPGRHHDFFGQMLEEKEVVNPAQNN